MSKNGLLKALKELEAYAVDMQGAGDPKQYDANVARMHDTARRLRKLVQTSAKSTLRRVLIP